MEKNKDNQKEVEFQEGTQVQIEKNMVKVTGDKGTIEKNLGYPGIKIQVKDKKIILTSDKSSKKSKRLLGTFTAHINNLIQGASSGYTYKLKICSGHFPMKVSLDEKEVIISNFLGEKIPRKAKILEGAKVKLENDILIVEGLDKEKVGQTSANIERATRITNRDRRVFQDGCFLLNKGKK